MISCYLEPSAIRESTSSISYSYITFHGSEDDRRRSEIGGWAPRLAMLSLHVSLPRGARRYLTAYSNTPLKPMTVSIRYHHWIAKLPNKLRLPSVKYSRKNSLPSQLFTINHTGKIHHRRAPLIVEVIRNKKRFRSKFVLVLLSFSKWFIWKPAHTS